MRVIAGEARGRRLEALEGEEITRPTLSQVKEAMFSIVQFDLPGARVLDLFAGSGSLAFECLSRGAQEALLVEQSATAARCLARNIEELGLGERARLVREDVRKTLLRPPRFPFGLVFLDPPYHKNLCNMALTGLTERGWLAPEAYVVAEVELDAAVKTPDGLELLTERHFGQTRILIWTNA